MSRLSELRAAAEGVMMAGDCCSGCGSIMMRTSDGDVCMTCQMDRSSQVQGEPAWNAFKAESIPRVGTDDEVPPEREVVPVYSKPKEKIHDTHNRVFDGSTGGAGDRSAGLQPLPEVSEVARPPEVIDIEIRGDDAAQLEPRGVAAAGTGGEPDPQSPQTTPLPVERRSVTSEHWGEEFVERRGSETGHLDELYLDHLAQAEELFIQLRKHLLDAYQTQALIGVAIHKARTAR